MLLFSTVSYGYAKDALQYGGLLKQRYEYRDSIFDSATKTLQNESFLRTTIQLWGSYEIPGTMKAFGKINYQPDYYLDSYKPDNHGFMGYELIVENLYVDLKDPLGLPVDMTVGRQDMRYGDGLLISDGTPIDKSRASYFNAVKSSWKISQGHSVDIVYINDPKRDEFLPSVQMTHDEREQLNESDEQGVIVYGKNSFGNNIQLEPYYIFKREENIPSKSNALDIHTIGTRAVFASGSWKLKGEFAHQFGKYQGGGDRTGYGGTLYASKTLGATLWRPEIETGFIYLSGDNTNSTANEGWDPLFARRSWLSSFQSNMYKLETGYTAYWTNLQLYRLTTKLNFPTDTTLSISYNYLRANETTNAKGKAAAFLSNSGRERGHLAQIKLHQQISKSIDADMSLEYFFPGDFYRMRGNEAYLVTKIYFRF